MCGDAPKSSCGRLQSHPSEGFGLLWPAAFPLHGVSPHVRFAPTPVLNSATACGLKVCLSDPALLPELARHFERSGFRVARLADAVVVVPRGDVSPERAEWEIASHLRVWSVMHPGSVDERQPRVTCG